LIVFRSLPFMTDLRTVIFAAREAAFFLPAFRRRSGNPLSYPAVCCRLSVCAVLSEKRQFTDSLHGGLFCSCSRLSSRWPPSSSFSFQPCRNNIFIDGISRCLPADIFLLRLFISEGRRLCAEDGINPHLPVRVDEAELVFVRVRPPALDRKSFNVVVEVRNVVLVKN
jgi:hypothetical protein